MCALLQHQSEAKGEGLWRSTHLRRAWASMWACMVQWQRSQSLVRHSSTRRMRRAIGQWRRLLQEGAVCVHRHVEPGPRYAMLAPMQSLQRAWRWWITSQLLGHFGAQCERSAESHWEIEQVAASLTLWRELVETKCARDDAHSLFHRALTLHGCLKGLRTWWVQSQDGSVAARQVVLAHQWFERRCIKAFHSRLHCLRQAASRSLENHKVLVMYQRHCALRLEESAWESWCEMLRRRLARCSAWKDFEAHISATCCLKSLKTGTTLAATFATH